VGGRIPCVVGVSSYTPKEVIDLAQHAISIGASGVMITPPPYYNLTEDEIYNFYKVINDHVSIPIMIYNWPRGVGVDMSAILLANLANLSKVIAIKESSGDEGKTIKVLEKLLDGRKSIKFFARFIHPEGSQYLQRVGGDGNIDGGGLGAKFAVRFYNAWWQKDSVSMKENSIAYANLSSKLIHSDYSGKFGSPIAQLKACMRILNQPGGFVRPPIMEINDAKVLSQLQSLLTSSIYTGND
jgi:4-hydroxy-tetrahydrodipicolinate synthase